MTISSPPASIMYLGGNGGIGLSTGRRIFSTSIAINSPVVASGGLHRSRRVSGWSDHAGRLAAGNPRTSETRRHALGRIVGLPLARQRGEDGGRMASSKPVARVSVSIVPLFVLYYSSILPLVLIEIALP